MKPGKRRWGTLRYGRKIRNVLLTYYLTPILFLLLASGAFFYVSAQRALDEEMGQRLISIAMGGAGQLRGYHVAALEIHDVQSLTYHALKIRFEKLRADNHASRLYLFNPRHESLLDTDAEVPLGSLYEKNQLHLAELDVAMQGKPVSSTLFRGADGAFYKSAFAPVIDQDKVVAIVGVDGSATFFGNLHRLGRQLAVFSLVCVAVIIFVSVFISRRIVQPVQTLVAAAQRIGDGHLDESVEVRSENEIGFLGFVLDEMRMSIVNRDREMQMMLKGIAHEVRNPLGGIELFAGMLDEETSDPHAREAIGRIKREVKTLESLVAEFLDFARGPSLQVSKVKLQPFLDDLRHAFHKELSTLNIVYRVDVNGTEGAEFDSDQMRRAFLNLIRNAIQAMPNGGSIDITAQDAGGQVEIAIQDTGLGIEAQDLERIFDPFFTHKEGGTGLGLSFVKKIVTAHGGEVRVESTPGKGSTFRIVLPS